MQEIQGRRGSSPKDRTIAQWQAAFHQIYGTRNSALTGDEIWLHVVEESGELAKALRKEDFSRVEDELADIFAWVCGFATKELVELQDAMWEKYPKICPRCKSPKNCICIAIEMLQTDDEAMADPQVVAARDVSERPASVDSWQRMFADIYGPVNKAASKAQVGFHLLEEVGEVAGALRIDRRDLVRRELADVLAWTFALTVKFEKELVAESGLLSEVIWRRYPDVCKGCGQSPCMGD